MSSNPWENKPHSLLATSKEKRHIRLGGLRSVLQSHGVVEEGEELNKNATTLPDTERFFHLLDTISDLSKEKGRLLNEVAEYSASAEQAQRLTGSNLEASIGQIEAFTKYLEHIAQNEEKVSQVLAMRNHSSVGGKAAIKVNPIYQQDFCEFLRLTKTLLTNQASNLENIRWSQNSVKHLQNLKKISGLFDEAATTKDVEVVGAKYHNFEDKLGRGNVATVTP